MEVLIRSSQISAKAVADDLICTEDPIYDSSFADNHYRWA